MTHRSSSAPLPDDWAIARWPGIERARGFATTRNGPSGEPFDLGPARLDAIDATRRASVLANRAALMRCLPSAPVWLEQVHGRDVVTIDERALDHARSAPPTADAAVTCLRNVPLAIRVADCLPVLFVDDAASVVAAAHAGWRGLASGVLEATVEAMAVAPSHIAAWIGPGISGAAFEVGNDVLEAFNVDDAYAERCFVRHGERWKADLVSLARSRLERAGVERITIDGSCTFLEPARFFSWRRERTPARQAALAWLEG